MKKNLVFLSVLIPLVFNISAVSASVKIFESGAQAEFKNEPVIMNDRTMVPAEEFFNLSHISYQSIGENAFSVTGDEGDILIEENAPIGSDVSVSVNGVLYMPLRAVLEGIGQKVDWNDAERSVIISKIRLSADAQKIKDGKKAAIVFIHDDGYRGTIAWLNTMFPKYNINGTIALWGKYAVPIEEDEEYHNWWIDNVDEKERWNIASHSKNHEYLGQTDEAESGVLKNGNEYNYAAGHLTEQIAGERERINSIFPNQRVLAFIKPGTSTPEGLPQVSETAEKMIKEHYIAMRNTGGGVDTLPPEDIYSVKSLMATSRNEYDDVENNHTSEYWISYMDSAIEQNGLLTYLFHGIEDETGARWNTLAKSRTEMLLSAIGDRLEAGIIWNGKFDEVMQYTQEFNAITGVWAENNPSDEYISVKVTDSISKIDPDLKDGKFAGLDMFDYPITVKVELPYGWEYAKLTQEYNSRVEILKPFTEDGVRYVYANVVPDQEPAIICKANEDDYVSKITVDGKELADFDAAKFYYKVIRPAGEVSVPFVECSNPDARVTQAELDENGEGSAFIALGSIKYEIFFCNEKVGPNVLLRIDTSFDDKNLTETKKLVEFFAERGEAANIIDKSAFDVLKDEYDNVKYCDLKTDDDCAFDFDDTFTEDIEGDYMSDYNQFAIAYKEVQKDILVMTVHPQDKRARLDEQFRDIDILFEIFKDQIRFLDLQGAKLIGADKF